MNLQEFYDVHADKVYKFFYIKSLDRMTSEDLTSTTFMLFMEQAKLREIDKQTSYLYGIMRNVWAQFLRDKYRHAVADIESIDDFESYVDKFAAEFDDADEPKARLQPYIEALPKQQKRVITMRIVQDKSVKEVAKELGKDTNYVKTTYKRALRSLRARLSQPYIEERL